MHFTENDIQQLDRIPRLNLINAITGVKPANLIGTVSSDGVTNLAIFSSVVHLGSSPALLGMFVRPHTGHRRDTYENIIATRHYTVNHVPVHLTEQAHRTSARFDREVSEFDACGFTPLTMEGFPAPFVAESPVRIGLQLVEEHPIAANGTTLLIGKVVHLHVEDGLLNADYQLDLEAARTVGISGLDGYYGLQQIGRYPYAKVQI
jgi:flavin reductase (DIM6/NTAB) family NADH-FMN oxidoreductase RutF